MGGFEEDPQAEEKKPYVILIKPLAAQNVRDAYDWYEDRVQGLGERFKDAFDDCCNQIREYPFRCAPVYRDVRRFLFKTFPYHAYYRIKHDTIKIL